LAIVFVALALRVLRAGLRWDEIALAYAAYQQPWVDAANAGDVGGMLSTFVGLHPPAYSAVFWLSESILGAPVGLLLISAIFSTLAVFFVGRVGGLAAAALLAVDPLQVAYAGEVNNYPMLMAAVGALFWTRELAAKEGRFGLLLSVSIVAAWTHMLGGVVAGFVLVSLIPNNRKSALLCLGALALSVVPLAPALIQLGAADGTYGQAGFDLGLVATTLGGKLGWWWLLVLPALLGSTRVRWVAFVGGGTFVTIAVMLFFGVAAPHQAPYWLVLGAPVAILAAKGAPRLSLVVAFAGLCFTSSVEVRAFQSITVDLERPRGVDAMLRDANASDVFWLVAPSLTPDDDKRDTSSVLWRFPPTTSMSPWRGPEFVPKGDTWSFEFTDWRYGQPRTYEGHVLHTSVDLVEGTIEEGCVRTFDSRLPFEQTARRHLLDGRRVWVLLYDYAPACDAIGGVMYALEPFSFACERVGDDRGLGTDMLCLIDGVLE
jgi:hypothetical protein